MRSLKRVLRLVMVISLFTALLVPVALAEESAKIDLNKASVEDLIKIKGIGEKYAERIVDYRDKNGQFNQIEDIMNVKGIGSKKFESIRELVVVNLPEE